MILPNFNHVINIKFILIKRLILLIKDNVYYSSDLILPL
jgi:hypothetical protein